MSSAYCTDKLCLGIFINIHERNMFSKEISTITITLYLNTYHVLTYRENIRIVKINKYTILTAVLISVNGSC